MIRLSAIDIGTNTILMLIADVSRDGTIHVIRDEHIIARLGRGVDANHRILPETFDRVLGYLAEYKRIHEAEHADRLIACGTSALRDAANGSDFIDFIRTRLGFEISVLSGDEEAHLTYLGGISEFLKPDRQQNFVVLDIGGGSTELVSGRGTSVQSKVSLDIGSVRLTERFLKASPPATDDFERARDYVKLHLHSLVQTSTETQCIGVAGTLTTLASIDLQLRAYDRNRVSGHVLGLETIKGILERLKEKNLEELKAIPQILPQRADIIVAGILILSEVMNQIGINEIAVSDRGLRYGIVMREAEAQRAH